MLITLGIIGVVAAMTIPTLIHEQKKAQTIVKLKEVYSIFGSIAPKLTADFGTGGVGTPYSEEDTKLIFDEYFKPNLKIVKDCGTVSDGCWIQSPSKYLYVDNHTEDLYSAKKGCRYFVLANGTRARMYIGGGGEVNIYFDINGDKSKNTVGIDIFVLGLYPSVGIKPRGYAFSDATLDYYVNNRKTSLAAGMDYALPKIIRDSWQITYW